MRLPWLAGMNVGIPLMDEEHRRLFELLHELGVSIEQGNPPGARMLAEDYLSCIEEHFMEEEVVMARYGYPGAETHQIGHRRCLTLLRNAVTAIAAGHLGRAEEWLAEYMNEYFGDLLREDGLLGHYLQEVAPDKSVGYA